MFGCAKKENDGARNADIETIIGKNTQIKGAISGSGNIRIDGKLEGEINVQGDIVIGENGEVLANLKAKNVLISGTVNGNIDIDGKLEILETGTLRGDIKATILSIAEGAVFKGNSTMESPRKALQESVPEAPKKHK